jgi:DNA-binding PadR family transcriptional regulator
VPPRRPGEITQLERDILTVALELEQQSDGPVAWFWAYGLASVLEGRYDKRALLDHGTLYKVLKAMSSTSRELLETRLEDETEAHGHRGPARRYYRIAPNGRECLERAEAKLSVTEHLGLLSFGTNDEIAGAV